jgi:hypothetical protein
MMKDFMREVARDGWVIDGAIHPPDKDNHNWHAHAHLPMRHITPDGLGKRRELDLRKTCGPTRQEELVHWKSRWSELGARQLKRAGHEAEGERFRHGHETLNVQRVKAYGRGDKAFGNSLDREPQVHMGPVAWAMEKHNVRTYKGEVSVPS